jgi:hypothetical protein
MKNVVFMNVTPCDSCKNIRFGATCRFHHQGGKNQLGTASIVQSSLILPTLIMEAIHSSKTSVFISCMTSHPKRALFIVTAVKTSNLIYTDIYFQTCISEPALYKHLTFHFQISRPFSFALRIRPSRKPFVVFRYEVMFTVRSCWPYT